MPGSPYDNLGTVVTKWLSVVPSSQIRCSNKQVVDKIKDIVLEDDEVIVSFDVSSLYTNVPVKEAIEYCADLLFSRFQIPVDRKTFVTLAEIACCDVIMATHDGFLHPSGWTCDGKSTSTSFGKWMDVTI